MNIIDKIYMFVLGKKYHKKDFSKLNNILQSGDIILTQTDGLIADGIEWFSGGDVSHSALYVGNGKVIEALIEGVRLKNISRYYKDNYTITVRRIPNLTEEQANKMKEYAYSRINKKYDKKQFITLAFYFILDKLGIKHERIVWDSNDQDICSELCNDAAKFAGRKISNQKDSVITPQDLLVTGRMKTVAKE